jgi:phage terminase large subunit-like protein
MPEPEKLDPFHGLSQEQLQAALENLKAEKSKRQSESKLLSYKPHPKQAEFHAAGARFRERLLCAGNQVGKSLSCAMEVAMHASGIYPPKWKGKKFDRALRIWACGETSEVVRDTCQRLLLGEPGDHGTGAIPRAALVDVTPARGIADLVDTIRVRHTSGGISTIALKAYSQGRERFQGSTIDFAWMDEEPDQPVFSEILTRTNTTSGPTILSFTPLKGMSTVVKRYLMDPSPTRHVTYMTLADAKHYTAAQRAEIIAQYPEDERDARTKGIPTMGSGRVFTIPEEKLIVQPFECPSHWVRVGGIDFGWSHYAAFCELWHDRDLDCIYLVRTLRMREKTPHQHVDAVRDWKLLRWMWPHDGRNSTLAGAGIPLMRQYDEAGLDMWHEAVSFPDGGNSVEAGIQMMIDRMRGERWKVFKGANDGWLEEYRMFHRGEDGMLVKEGDDAISASRYGMMGMRHGISAAASARMRGKIIYPNLGIA